MTVFFIPPTMLRKKETIKLQNPKIKNAGDYWDVDISREYFVLTDPDYGRALGAVKLRSVRNLRATRIGSEVRITGDINHNINDTYDFNDDTLFDKKAFKNYRLLAKKGYAKPFKVSGRKK